MLGILDPRTWITRSASRRTSNRRHYLLRSAPFGHSCHRPAGPTIGYLVLVTNGVTDINGTAATPDAEYLTARTGAIEDLTAGINPPTCASVTNLTLNGVCRLTYAHLAIGSQALAIPPQNVVASFSFSTVATRDTLTILAATTLQREYSIAATGLNTSFMGLPGIADIFAGSLNIDYRLAVPPDDTSNVVLTTPWQAAGPSPVPGDQILIAVT